MKLFYLFLFLLFSIHSTFAETTYIWREAETADTATFPLNTSEVPTLSGGKWMSFNPGDNPDAEKTFELTYKIDAPKAGDYNLWLRLGFEFVRPFYRWRIDEGEWKEIKPTELTRDMTELSMWCEVGWFDAGKVNLTAGKHELEIIAEPNEERLCLSIDVIAFVQGEWLPSADLKPGEVPNKKQDIEAAANVFKYTENKTDPTERTTISLWGLWQICRDDDMDMMKDRFEPIKEVPKNPVWRGIKVPSDIYSVPELNYAHRVWYKCKIDVPEQFKGKSFQLDFTGTNWIASVVVNGQYIGCQKSTRVQWLIDISKAIKPGQINEICVGIKDYYYGLDRGDQPIDSIRNMPESFVEKYVRSLGPFYPSTKGDADGTKCGITDAVSMVISSPVFPEDYFIKTHMKNKRIDVDVNLVNTLNTDVDVTIRGEAIFEKTNAVEKELPVISLKMKAGENKVVNLTAGWDNPKLWWPEDDPANMYKLRTYITVNGKLTEWRDTPFGFREVTIDGKYIRINGVRRNFWNLLGGLEGITEQDMLNNFRKSGNRFERMSADLGLSRFGARRNQLDWTDKHGIPVRLSTMIDGMGITHNEMKIEFWENCKLHIEQVIKAYKNHPSIITYSLENELLFIESRLGYGGQLDLMEDRAKKYLIDVARNLDPTRSSMLDGAGALKDQYADICNTHYAEDGFFGDNARSIDGVAVNAAGYTIDPNAQKGNDIATGSRWVWDGKRPYCAGEIAYFAGNNVDHAWIGGEKAAEGRPEALEAYAKYVKYIFERYRWNDVAMIFPWVAQDGSEVCWNAMSSLAAFTREYSTSFFGGEASEITVKVFNDTLKADPVTFTWQWVIDGKKVAGGSKILNVEPGFGQEIKISDKLPVVAARTDMQFILEVTQPGSKSFKDVKEYALFPRVNKIDYDKVVYVVGNDNTFAERMQKLGLNVTLIPDAGKAKNYNSLMLISPRYKGDMKSIIAFAREGGRVVSLEQDTPLQGIDLPYNLEVEKKSKLYFTYAEGIANKLFKGLKMQDLSNWRGFGPTAINPWKKPSAQAIGWIVGGPPAIDRCALVEMPCGKGLIVASQMLIDEKFDIEPAAGVLLNNMINKAVEYKLESAVKVLVYATKKSGIEKKLKDIGCQLREDLQLEEAISDSKAAPFIIVSGTRDNLNILSDNADVVKKYMNSGGWIMVWGLEPNAVDAYNNILDTKHVFREFRVERVGLNRDKLTEGMDTSDFSMSSSVVIAEWMNLKRLSADIFTGCVDSGTDIAPFTFGPYNPNYTFQPSGAIAMVNGLRNADFWMYVNQFGGLWGDIPAEGKNIHTFKLPYQMEINNIKIWNNTNYNSIENLDINADGKKIGAMILPDNRNMTFLECNNVKAAEISLMLKSYRRKGWSGMAGIDVVQINRKLPEWMSEGKIVPLDTIGGLVKYPRGNGGLILNNLKIAVGDLPGNNDKKNRIVSALMHNINVSFSASEGENANGPDDPE